MIRLFVPDSLRAGAIVRPTADQAHYLTNVMRRRAGEPVALFNGRDGEWRATLTAASKRGCDLAVDVQTRDQTSGPDLELIIALVKRTRLETIVEKAAELGARRVRLVLTRFTNADHAKVARLQAVAVEASEQTGRLDVPQVLGPERLEQVLDGWDMGRALVFCDEAGDARPATEALTDWARAHPLAGPAAVVIGPEGGFSPDERARLRALPFVLPVSLGPRILRADTAAISALTLWQAAVGDWR